MFGYIKLDSNSQRILNEVFKKNYCILCRAIEQHYGQLPRFLLSFDVTFLFIMFSNQEQHKDIKKVKCFGNKFDIKQKIKNEELAKKCAALNLAMAQAELLDHIHDDKSVIAKIILFLLKRPFNKVKRDYPTMWNTLIDGYSLFDKYEQENRSIDEIEEMFAKLIVGIAEKEFDIKDSYDLNILSYVAKWLYFIDACDDLDKDIKTNSFNALKNFKSCKELFNNTNPFFREHLTKIQNGLLPIPSKDLNRIVVNRIVFCGIPESTYKVAMRKNKNEYIC